MDQLGLSNFDIFQANLIQAFVSGDADPIEKIKSQFSASHADIVAGIESVEAAKKEENDVQVLVKKFGLSCSLPGSFHVSSWLL